MAAWQWCLHAKLRLFQQAPHELSSEAAAWAWVTTALHARGSGRAFRGQLLMHAARAGIPTAAARDESEEAAMLDGVAHRLAVQCVRDAARKYRSVPFLALLADLALLPTAGAHVSQDATVPSDGRRRHSGLPSAAQLSTAMSAVHQAMCQLVWYEADRRLVLQQRVQQLRDALDHHHAAGGGAGAGSRDVELHAVQHKHGGDGASATSGGKVSFAGTVTSAGGGDDGGGGGGADGVGSVGADGALGDAGDRRDASGHLTPSRLHRFHNAMRDAGKADLRAARAVATVWSLLGESAVSMPAVEKACMRMRSAATDANAQYVRAISTIPDCATARRQYAEFVASVADMGGEAQHMLQVAQRVAATCDRTSLGSVSAPLSSMRLMAPMAPLHDLAADVDGEVASLLCSALPRRGFAIREASTTLGSMLGMSASEMAGLDVASLFPSALREGMLQALTAAQSCFGGDAVSSRAAGASSGDGMRVHIGRSQVWLLWHHAQRQLVPVVATVHLVHANREGLGAGAAEPLLKMFFAAVQDRSGVFLVNFQDRGLAVPASDVRLLAGCSRSCQMLQRSEALGKSRFDPSNDTLDIQRLSVADILGDTADGRGGQDVFLPESATRLQVVAGSAHEAAYSLLAHLSDLHASSTASDSSASGVLGSQGRLGVLVLIAAAGSPAPWPNGGAEEDSCSALQVHTMSAADVPSSAVCRLGAGSFTVNFGPESDQVSAASQLSVQLAQQPTGPEPGQVSAASQQSVQLAQQPTVADLNAREAPSKDISLDDEAIGIEAFVGAPSSRDETPAAHAPSLSSVAARSMYGGTSASDSDSSAGLFGISLTPRGKNSSPQHYDSSGSLPSPSFAIGPSKGASDLVGDHDMSIPEMDSKADGSMLVHSRMRSDLLGDPLPRTRTNTLSGERAQLTGRGAGSPPALPTRLRSMSGGPGGFKLPPASRRASRQVSEISGDSGVSFVSGASRFSHMTASQQKARMTQRVRRNTVVLALDMESLGSAVSVVTRVQQGRLDMQRQLLGIHNDSVSRRALALWGGGDSIGKPSFRSETVSRAKRFLFCLVPVVILAAILPTPLLFDPLLRNVSNLYDGLAANGQRLQTSQFIEAALQRMFVRPRFEAEPVADNLLELRQLEGDFELAADWVQQEHLLSKQLTENAAAAAGVDVNAVYAPPRNTSRAALQAQFDADIRSERYWSDHQRWVPIADDTVNGERILTPFEVGQWVQANMRSVVQLAPGDFRPPAPDASVQALLLSGMMQARVWPAFNTSVQARIRTLQHHVDTETQDLAFHIILSACTILAITLVWVAGDSVLVAEAAHTPLILAARMHHDVQQQIQERAVRRCAALQSRLAGKDSLPLMLEALEIAAQSTTPTGVPLGSASNGSVALPDSQQRMVRSFSGVQPARSSATQESDASGGIAFQRTAPNPSSRTGSLDSASSTPQASPKASISISSRALKLWTQARSSLDILAPPPRDAAAARVPPAPRKTGTFSGTTLVDDTHAPTRSRLHSLDANNPVEVSARHRTQSTASSAVGCQALNAMQVTSTQLRRKWRPPQSDAVSRPFALRNFCVIALAPIASLIIATVSTFQLITVALPSVYNGIARTVWVLETSTHLYDARDAAVEVSLGDGSAIPAARFHIAAAVAKVVKTIEGAPDGPVGRAVPELPSDSAVYHMLLEDGCVSPHRWQFNCSTAFDGVAKRGGLIQPLQKMKSLIERIIQKHEQARLNGTERFIQNAPAVQAMTFELVALDKRLTRDTIRAVLDEIRDQVQDSLQMYSGLLQIGAVLNALLLTTLTVAGMFYMDFLNRTVLSARLILLFLPEKEMQTKQGQYHWLYSRLLVAHTKESSG